MVNVDWWFRFRFRYGVVGALLDNVTLITPCTVPYDQPAKWPTNNFEKRHFHPFVTHVGPKLAQAGLSVSLLIEPKPVCGYYCVFGLFCWKNKKSGGLW